MTARDIFGFYFKNPFFGTILFAARGVYMVKKRWFVISIIELVVIIAIAAIFLCHNLLPSSYKEVDLSENIIATSVGNTYDFGECGYIADANTAKRICSPIIDDMVGKDFIGLYDIEYDKENETDC